MNKFESTIVLKPDVTKKMKDEIINKFKTLAKDVEIDERGKKILAYEVKGYKEGIYIVFNFKSTNKINRELEDYIKNNLNILKYIILKGEE